MFAPDTMVCVEWCWKVCSSFYFYVQFLTLWSIQLTRLWPHITITRPSLHHQNSSCEDNTSTSEVSDWPVATGSDFLKIFLDKFWVPLDITFKIFPSSIFKINFWSFFFFIWRSHLALSCYLLTKDSLVATNNQGIISPRSFSSSSGHLKSKLMKNISLILSYNLCWYK